MFLRPIIPPTTKVKQTKKDAKDQISTRLPLCSTPMRKTNDITRGIRSKSEDSRIPSLAFLGPSRKNPAGSHKYADRFVPSRSMTDIDKSNHMLVNTLEAKTSKLSLKQEEHNNRLTESLGNGQVAQSRILTFKTKTLPSKEMGNIFAKYGAKENTKAIIDVTKPKKISTRFIPTEPDRVLDAPELEDNYYNNVLDWSHDNFVSIGLTNKAYLWNATNGSIFSLVEYDEPTQVCSLAFMQTGSVIAVGLNDGTVELFDIAERKRIRRMGCHSGRVTALAWNNHVLSTGGSDYKICHNDVRVRWHRSSELSSHTGDICGLKWSPNGCQLASGGNDNCVYVWEDGQTSPAHRFNEHRSAVKALAWCPFKANTLASAGGIADRKIKLWNTSLGINMQTVQTNSQVSSLLWNAHYQELLSGHGPDDNQLTLWQYPGLKKIKLLSGHDSRILGLASSPDGQCVASIGGDETLRIWNCWSIDPYEESRKQVQISRQRPRSALAATIR